MAVTRLGPTIIDADIDNDAATVDGARSAAIADVDSSTIDATYGAQEQAVLGDVRTKLNSVLAALRKVGIIEE